ncbi:chromosomal replication initiator protein DnaA [Candidatus Berkelbacteria bacterium]|nr:chromosomal replication initiator protein DnaA [Candidatus Berkelbacteria bacterium]
MSSTIWQQVVEKLEAKISRPNYVTWLKPVKFLSNDGGIFNLSVPNYYAKEWLDKNLKTEIISLLSELSKDFKQLNIVIRDAGAKATNEDLPPLLQTISEEAAQNEQTEENETINRNYTFNSFIVGNNNRLAFAAAEAVAQKPGTTYNPLFIYGGVGLGKTHLMHAVANEIIKSNPKKKIIYTSCETFTGEFIHSIQNKTINDFKKKYRTVDVLLIDDIQFLSNKEGTQEEFFHTFNALHQTNRQIIVTSDRVPKEINNLEDRLVSRFGWGMIADIQTPNFENRMAIISAKAMERGLTIPDEVLSYIATAITSNVRELEGSLTKLVMAAHVEGIELTKEFAARTLKEFSGQKETNISSRKVIKVVAEYFGINTADILGSKRLKELVYPRQIVMYILRERCKLSYPQIGEVLSGKDHTTIMYGVNKMEQQIKKSAQTEEDIKNINKELEL